MRQVWFDLRTLAADVAGYSDLRLIPRFRHADKVLDALEPSALRTRLQQLEHRRDLALKTARLAGMDLREDLTVGRGLLTELSAARVEAVLHLAGAVTDDEWKTHDQLLPAAIACLEVEKAGVRLDVEVLKDDRDDPAGFIRSMRGQQKDGWVTVSLDPFGTRTGRFSVRRGMNCLGIPHGRPRETIVSRFKGGRIYTLDFNAIDYRCLVSALGGELASFYADCPDFHERTRRAIMGGRFDRKSVKAGTYVSLYGGSAASVAAKTSLPLADVGEMLAAFDLLFAPLHAFRKSISLAARAAGFIVIPNGERVSVNADDHDGKVLGLYAQTHSSVVFREAFTAVVEHLRTLRSKVIFTVHDEIVVDAHPDEFCLMEAAGRVMENYNGENKYPVKVKYGRTYAEATG